MKKMFAVMVCGAMLLGVAVANDKKADAHHETAKPSGKKDSHGKESHAKHEKKGHEKKAH